MHESYKKWLDDGKPKVICKCGCGKEIIVKEGSKWRGISKFIRGHNENSKFTAIHKSYKKWLEDEYPKIYCNCGCNREIVIKNGHKYYGIPKYIVGHHPLSKKHIEKLRKIHLGKSLSEKHKQKISESNIGKHNNFGKKHTEKTKQKMHDAQIGDKGSNWKGGISFLPYCEKFNNRKREEIRNQFGRKCYLCGKNEKDNKYKSGKQIKLSVHHIDNDKEQGCNGKQWKLIPLCIHCHNSKKHIKNEN